MGEIALTAGLWPGGIRIQEDTWPVVRLREGIERLVALVRVRSLTHRFVALTSASSRAEGKQWTTEDTEDTEEGFRR